MGFDNSHPAISFLFFSTVIAFTIWLRHPVFLIISFVAAIITSVKLSGKKALIFDLVLLPVLAVFVVLFASYHHFGMTVLAQWEAGNPITLESILYSLTIGLCAGGVIVWMSCVHAVVTTDHVVYLFGRISPKLSLFVSVLLRAVPRVKTQYRKIALAQQAIGRGSNQGNPAQRVLHFFRILSILVTWMIESFIYSSESMKSRGYTLKGRTAYSMYRFDKRDRLLVLVLFVGILFTVMGGLLDQAAYQFDPILVSTPVTGVTWVFYGVFLLYCLFPFGMQVKADFHYREVK